MTLPGFDVSLFNRPNPAVIAGATFIFAQCTVGTWHDPDFAAWQVAAHAVPTIVLRGGYHYAVYGPGDGRQAAAFLSAVGDVGVLAIDVEAGGSHGILAHPEVASGIIEDVKRYDPRKRLVGLYSSDLTTVADGRSVWDAVEGYDFRWVARYGSAPVHPWTFWQRSGTQPADTDLFDGDLAALKAMNR